MSQPERSPLARLVLFMFCLSIAGSLVAGIHYAAIDIPQQEFSASQPTNSNSNCYPVDWWTAMWRMIFRIGSCGSNPSGNECCD
jgi:hypothetical protein